MFPFLPHSPPPNPLPLPQPQPSTRAKSVLAGDPVLREGWRPIRELKANAWWTVEDQVEAGGRLDHLGAETRWHTCRPQCKPILPAAPSHLNPSLPPWRGSGWGLQCIGLLGHRSCRARLLKSMVSRLVGCIPLLE